MSPIVYASKSVPAMALDIRTLSLLALPEMAEWIREYRGMRDSDAKLVADEILAADTLRAAIMRGGARVIAKFDGEDIEFRELSMSCDYGNATIHACNAAGDRIQTSFYELSFRFAVGDASIWQSVP